MATAIISKKFAKIKETKQLQIKAALFDELMEFLEDRYLGYLMDSVEKEQNIPILKAKKIIKK